MGTYDDLAVGERFLTPSRVLDPDAVEAIIHYGGFTHPLFTDPGYAAASAFGKRPLPGQGIVLVTGGLAEQSGRFDDTVVALVGLDEVRFRAPAFAGDEVHAEIEVLAKEPKEGRGVLVMAWRCFRGEQLLAEMTARMLFTRAD